MAPFLCARISIINVSTSCGWIDHRGWNSSNNATLCACVQRRARCTARGGMLREEGEEEGEEEKAHLRTGGEGLLVTILRLFIFYSDPTDLTISLCVFASGG